MFFVNLKSFKYEGNIKNNAWDTLYNYVQGKIKPKKRELIYYNPKYNIEVELIKIRNYDSAPAYTFAILKTRTKHIAISAQNSLWNNLETFKKILKKEIDAKKRFYYHALDSITETTVTVCSVLSEYNKLNEQNYEIAKLIYIRVLDMLKLHGLIS